MKKIILIIFSLFLFPGAFTQFSVNGGGSVASYQGPGDIVAGATAWWGLRSYNAAYATGSNNGIDICDTSTGLTCTTGIKILSNGKIDVATAAASSACAVSCSVTKIYDQVGTNHMTCNSGAIAKCPVLTFNCIGSLPCMTSAGGAIGLVSAATVAFALPYSISSASERTSGSSTAAAISLSFSAQNVTMGYGAANVGTVLWGGGDTKTATANDNSWHGEIITANTGATTFNVDTQAQATGSVPGTPGTDKIYLFCRQETGVPLTGMVVEGGIWNGTLFNNTQIANLISNQKTYWGY